MNKSFLSALVASGVLLGTGGAFAQSTTTTTTETWTTDQGSMMRDYYTTKKYTPYSDTSMHPMVGTALPPNVTLYSLPETVKVPNASNYSYVIINDKPVVVERTSRKVVHMW